jgi:hypothetical protein
MARLGLSVSNGVPIGGGALADWLVTAAVTLRCGGVVTQPALVALAFIAPTANAAATAAEATTAPSWLTRKSGRPRKVTPNVVAGD